MFDRWGNITEAVQARLAAARQAFERTSVRERVLIGILVTGLIAYAPIHALDRKSAQTDAYIEALGERSSARLAAQMARRISESAADSAVLKDMETWGFKARNAPIAKILIEQKLFEAVEALEFDEAEIITQPRVEAEGPTHWMFADVQTELKWGKAFGLIDDIGAWPEGFRVTSFQYEITRAGGQVLRNGTITNDEGKIRIGLAFPVQLDELPEDLGPTRTSARSAS